jgi:hypothetical protein
VAAESGMAVVGQGSVGAAVTSVRAAIAASLRRVVALPREQAGPAAATVIDGLVAGGRLVRDGDVVRRPGTGPEPPDPLLAAAMDRLAALLEVTTPPSLAEAARLAQCPAEGVRALERAIRIVVLEPDLAYGISIYRDVTARAVAMAVREPLTPAAFRDATGTSRKYVMAILEDLDRRAILRRTPDGHVPGPRAPRPAGTMS